MGDGWLAILRHGKAKADSPTGFDADRPLADRGHRQAEWLGQELADAGFAGSAVLASPADRTWTTASIVAAMLGVEPVREQRLFLSGTVESVFEAIGSQTSAHRIVIVGHNPTVSLAASVLTHGVGPCAISLRTGEGALCRCSGVVEPGAAQLDRVIRLSEKEQFPR